MLPIWQPGPGLEREASVRWARAALHIAIGVQVIAHFPGIVDQSRHVAGFCAGSASEAERLAALVRMENIEARVGRLHPDDSNQEACDVQLPCAPDATERNVEEAVLGAIKAAHPAECLLPALREG